MRSVSVFVSSTRKDLAQDCRVVVIEAINKCEAIAVAQETWTTDIQHSVEFCRKRLQDCSHYLGLFAYRRGYVLPKEGSKSMTELEFDWAIKLKKKSAVFIPDDTKPFSKNLRERCKDQSESEFKAQEEFLNKICAEGVYTLFEDPYDLAIRVSRLITIWQLGGLGAIVKNQARYSNSYLIANIGRIEHEGRFLNLLVNIRKKSVNYICFVIHGPRGYGHMYLADRLSKITERENDRETKYLKIPVSHADKTATPEDLLVKMSRLIRIKDSSSSFRRLSNGLRDILNDQHCLLDLRNIHNFKGSLNGFITGFWQPLISNFGENMPNNLIVLLTFEESEFPPGCTELLLDAAKNGTVNFSPSKPLLLPSLERFTVREITDYLVELGYSRYNAINRAKELIDECDQGNPLFLLQKLQEFDSFQETA